MTILEAKKSFKSQPNVIDMGCNSVVFSWFLDKFGSAIGEFYYLVAYFFKRDKFKSFRFDECQIFDYFL